MQAQSRDSAPRPPLPGADPSPLVVVGPFDRDVLTVLDTLKPARWAVHWAPTCGGAMRLIRRMDVPVVLCEYELPDGGWRTLWLQAQALPRPPRIVVTAVLADERLWVEVLNLGAHDVLPRPFLAAEVVRIVEAARQSWSAFGREKKHRQSGRS